MIWLLGWLSGWLVGCNRVPDPRAELVTRLGSTSPIAMAPADALLADQTAAACLGYKHLVVTAPSDLAWRGLLTAAARHPGCLAAADGDALSAWAGSLTNAEDWRGARAEWSLSQQRDQEAVKLIESGPGHAAARMRVALRLNDPQRALTAAEEVLAATPSDVVACRLASQDALRRRDLAQAAEEARCAGQQSTTLRRLEADILDLAGETEQAAARYEALGLGMHALVLRYQDGRPEQRTAARAALVSEPGPAAALHRVWAALIAGEPITEADTTILSDLDESPEAQMARALVLGAQVPPELLTLLAEYPGSTSAIVRARVSMAMGNKDQARAELAKAIEADPAAEPVHRARIALTLMLGDDLEPALQSWTAVDPDHAALIGRGRRELPWAALVPWTWEALAAQKADPRISASAPQGEDDIGRAWRAAMALPDRNSQLDALDALQRQNPTLLGLAAARYRLAIAE